MKTKEQVDRSEIMTPQVLGSHEFNDERTTGFQVYRTKRPKENIGWMIGAIALFLGTILSLGRLTVIGQFLDDVLFNLPWGWMKFPIYLALITFTIAYYFNYHFKFKKRFLLMLVGAIVLTTWLMSLAILTYFYDSQVSVYDLKFEHLWDQDIFTKTFKMYWLNWKDYSIFSASYAESSKMDFWISSTGYVSLYSAGGLLGYLLASVSYYLSLPGAYIFYSFIFTIIGTWLLTGDALYWVKPKHKRRGRALRLLSLKTKNKPQNEDSPLISTKASLPWTETEHDQFLSDDLLTLQQYDNEVSLENRQLTTNDFIGTDSLDDEETLVPEQADLLTFADLKEDEIVNSNSKNPVFASTILQTNLNQKVTPRFQSRREPVTINEHTIKATSNDIPLTKLQQKRSLAPQPQATRQAQSDIYNRLDPQEARRLFERETSVTPFGKVAKNPIFKEVHWPNYQLPTLSLLDLGTNQILNRQYNQNYADQIVNYLNYWLESKNLDANCQLVTIGEAVTRYQFNCGPHLNALLLVNQEAEMKKAARVNSWRWDYNEQAPNPLIFELPNQIPLKVPLKEVLQGIPLNKQDYRLLFALGKRLSGELLTANLANMPHILLAGQKDAGKTMILSNLITSFLLRNKPDEVKLVIIDSPLKELINFSHLPHLLTPFITNEHHVYPVFQKLIKIIDQRYQLFSALKVRTIEEYNNKQDSSEKLPYLVIIINELNDLQKNYDWNLIAPKLRQLTEQGSAFGLHFVIATEHPELTLNDEVLKRNCPTRLALKLPNAQASEAILNQSGAEQLSGQGDLLFAYHGAPKLIRAQGVYLSQSELKRLLTFIYQQISALPKEEY